LIVAEKRWGGLFRNFYNRQVLVVFCFISIEARLLKKFYKAFFTGRYVKIL